MRYSDQLFTHMPLPGSHSDESLQREKYGYFFSPKSIYFVNYSLVKLRKIIL